MTGKLEELNPINDSEILIYSCGPTVYDYIHIGNARPMITFDCFRKYLSYLGYKVKFVQNFTDVDDKIIKRANEENKSFKEIAKKYIDEYKIDAKGLGVDPPTVEPKATQSMDDIIEIVKILIDKGYAYEIEGDVYFKTKHFKEYGKLSHMPLEDLEAGKRVTVNDLKEDPLDFAIWKKSKENEPFWYSPWGKGRPGWHIECSAMAKENLGESIDIHCGGMDLIFPHHENEIAQSECAFGKPFARYWMHNGYINIDNKKMSKSEGNFITVREIAKKYGYIPIRYLMLASHYRSPINYNKEILEQSIKALDRINNFKDSIEYNVGNLESGDIDKEDKDYIDKKFAKFNEALSNDFNTADAISSIFEIIRNFNQKVTLKEKSNRDTIIYLKDKLDIMLNILGLNKDNKNEENEDIDKEVLEIFEARNKARQEKNFKLADELRDKLGEMGYMVQESRKGSRLLKK